MVLCEECRWWKIKNYVVGQCKCPKWKYGYVYDYTKIPDDEILVEDDEGWGAFTGPKFGCVHGEKEV